MRERKQLARVACPNCGRHISRNRYGGPQDGLHYPREPRAPACRIVVLPDPHAPDFAPEHRVYDVEQVRESRGLSRLSIEDFVDELTGEWESEFGVGAYFRERAVG